MEAIESIDRECAALGGLFQQVVNDMKTGVPHYEDFISRAGKLHGQLKTTIYALGSFLDTFQKIADAATNTKGATREIGACLTRIVIRHKAMEARMKTLCSALLDCLVLPLQDKMEDWKKVANTLDKEHSKEYKKLRSELKKKTDNSTRLMKKQKKGKGQESDPKVDQSLCELSKHVRNLHEVEKAAVRRVLVEERSRYCTFIACLKPVLGEEISLVSELQQLEEVMVKLDKHTEDPFKLPEASEQVLSDIKSVSGGVVFQTPPSSPSSLGSRKSSMCSISSAGSSSGGSTNSPSHQAHHLHKQTRHNQVGGVGGLVHPMRLSSISSQDSGFTSQDTLFLRPGSPSGHHPRGSSSGGLKTPEGSEPELLNGGGWSVPGMPGPPLLSDRPHTISSAYEKQGHLHQRPALQPYTFNPPERTIMEEEERPCASPRGGGGGGGEESNSSRPPVPQRFINPDRPSLPNKTQAALTARLQLTQGGGVGAGGGGLPNFNCNQPDMVVPQPVYMNMSDLATLPSGNRDQMMEPPMMMMMMGEDGPDLKTPTAEDQSGLGSDGSSGSSGYGGSQIMAAATAELLPDGVPALQGQQQRGGRAPCQRPYSFTSGVVPELEFSEALGMQLGQNRGTLLRRSMSQQAGTNKPPIPPARRCSSTQEEDNSSNTTTPRGSMEFLPPPPPHLLHSDEEEEEGQGEVVTRRTMSVAESVRELQRRQSQQQQGGTARQSSPATLRRVQSMSGPSGCYSNTSAAATTTTTMDRSQIKAKLDAALASSPRGPRPASPARISPPQHQQEQIYAPVAALQQKIQQQQLTRLAHGHVEPGSVPHPPGPQISYPQQQQQQYCQQQQYEHQAAYSSYQQQQQQANGGSPEGEQYGFGMQFQIHSKSFYARQQQQQHQHQAQQHQQQFINYQQQQHHQHHHHHHHDQVMADMDPMLGQRPQPPDINGHLPPAAGGSFGQYGGGGGVHNGMGHCDLQSAMRVRQWIETRTVSDVRKVRPILNQEIQRGLSLRKTGVISDRSQPRF